jgi:hypothetical protein
VAGVGGNDELVGDRERVVPAAVGKRPARRIFARVTQTAASGADHDVNSSALLFPAELLDRASACVPTRIDSSNAPPSMR